MILSSETFCESLCSASNDVYSLSSQPCMSNHLTRDGAKLVPFDWNGSAFQMSLQGFSKQTHDVRVSESHREAAFTKIQMIHVFHKEDCSGRTEIMFHDFQLFLSASNETAKCYIQFNIQVGVSVIICVDQNYKNKNFPSTEPFAVVSLSPR